MPYSDSNEYYHDPENYQFRHRLMKGRLSGIRAKLSPKAIIIAPTNSLAYGILCAARDLCPYPNINISLVDTASPFVHINTVNIDVLITTPIPLFAHMKKNTYGMDMLQYLVVDDVNYSRIEKPGDIMSRIISKFSVLHSSSMDDHRRPYLRILFTGSTISESVMDGIYRYFPDPSIIPAPGAHKIPSRLNITTAVTTSAGLKHKLTSCVDIIKRNCALFKTFLIFCNSAESAEALTWHLLSLKYEAQLITSQIPLRNQAAIAKALTRRNSNHSEGEPVPAIPPTIYVSSGVFSFGLDTRAVDYVILFDRPRSRAEYLDRVGRVARGGHSGFASVILTKDEAKDFYKISSPARSGAN